MGTFSITGTNASFTYTNLTIDLDITVDEIDEPTDTVVNGQLKANSYMMQGGAGSGDFCLTDNAGEGTAVETDLVTGGLTINPGPGAGLMEQNYDIKYTCDATTLVIQERSNGSSVWGTYLYSN